MSPNIPLMAWLPDADPTAPGVMTDVGQLLPTVRGYAPERALGNAQYSAGTLPSRCYGAQFVRFASVSPMTFFGTDSSVHGAFGTMYDLSRATAYTTIASHAEAWRFASFGDVALCVSRYNQLQATSGPHGGTAFANVADAPTASTMCVSNDFVLLGYCAGTLAWPYADGVWCSGIQDHTDWDADLATQGKQMRLLQTPGGIVRLLAYQNYVIAFKEGSMLRGTYVGTPQVWRWDVISTSIGLIGHDAVCEVEGVLYWMSRNGFYRFAGGYPQRIESGPWHWLRTQQHDALFLAGAQAQWDTVRRCVRWYYPTGSTFDLAAGIAYHPASDRWGRFAHPVEWVTQSAYEVTGTTESVSSTIVAHDAPIVVDTTHAVRAFSGDPEDSHFVTGDIGDGDRVFGGFGARVLWHKAPTTSVMTHYHRMELGDALTTGASVSRANGKYDISHAARWHRLRFDQSGMSEALKFQVDAREAGKR